MTPRRHRPTGHRRRNALAAGGLILVVIAVTGAALAVFRYMPALDEARELRADLELTAAHVKATGLDIDSPTVDLLAQDLTAAHERLDRLSALLASDPFIGLARMFPPTQADVRGADTVVEAAQELLHAADEGLVIGKQFVEIKDRKEADPGTGSSLSKLLELMATSREHVSTIQGAFARARDALEAVPDGVADPIQNARQEMVGRIDELSPLVETYAAMSERLPAILGWDGTRRYLVLTQNPAELRPTGGYIGSYGILTFDRGHPTERTFRDVALLDFPWDFPFIKPPTELTNYLLGPAQPWQFADANWSPDFPTSARDALRLYVNESGDGRIDGVIGITTYTIDELLKVTGPVAVPEYDVTIASGETTLKSIELTRVPRPGENRKAFLSSFADRLFERLLAMPPRQWVDLLAQAETFGRQRLVLGWFKDADDQRLAARGGFDGAVRDDAGDYLYPVDSNVAPASKMNAIVTRSLRLEVSLDRLGNANNTLDVTWDNPIETAAGAPYRKVPTLESLRILGMYFRLMAPEGSRIESVSGGTLVKLTAPAMVGNEAGRAVIGTYLMVPPGSTTLRYAWTSPAAAVVYAGSGTYHLTIQKQPGLLAGPLSLTIQVPDGFEIRSASAGLRTSGATATAATSFSSDLEFDIGYEPVDATR
jgi:Protein of unknown function (DUF4012)